eukprot:2141128-Pyramimonas_sp.AAC.1
MRDSESELLAGELDSRLSETVPCAILVVSGAVPGILGLASRPLGPFLCYLKGRHSFLERRG